MDEGSFLLRDLDTDSLERKDGYEMILACDGADSAFLKSFKRYSDFTFSSVFSGWIYVEITIPPADDKGNA